MSPSVRKLRRAVIVHGLHPCLPVLVRYRDAEVVHSLPVADTKTATDDLFLFMSQVAVPLTDQFWLILNEVRALQILGIAGQSIIRLRINARVNDFAIDPGQGSSRRMRRRRGEDRASSHQTGPAAMNEVTLRQIDRSHADEVGNLGLQPRIRSRMTRSCVAKEFKPASLVGLPKRCHEDLCRCRRLRYSAHQHWRGCHLRCGRNRKTCRAGNRLVASIQTLCVFVRQLPAFCSSGRT